MSISKKELTRKFVQTIKECIPSRPCSKETVYGTITGKQCPSGKFVYHNTTTPILSKIVESGTLRLGQHKGVLGQDALSFSSCPTQGYGGNIKLVFQKDKLESEPMCYYIWEKENKEVDHRMEKEATQDVDGPAGANRVRAKYGVNLDMYKKECEQVVRKDVPLKDNLQKIEYWIPWKIGIYSFNHACEGHLPGYANVNGYWRGIEEMKKQIAEARQKAEELNVPFEVKSCFTALKTGFGDQYIALTKENMNMLARGETPEITEGKVPTKCRC